MKSTQFFQHDAQNKNIEQGKHTPISPRPEGRHDKHPTCENGKNVSRHVSRDQADAVQDALEGYQKFQNLTEQYAQVVIDQTRAELAAHSKKKIYNLRRKSSWPKTRKSSK